MSHKHKIQQIIPDSIAAELGIEPGDLLLTVNAHEITDVFDYYFQVENEAIVLLIEKPDGEQWELDIEKGEDEELGIVFQESLMDRYRSCCNQCIFCFIDQMPTGMRETLYFKDDDSRLSFLQGNYITLTNMSKQDIERIIHFHMEPINISFHSTNPDLRCKMLGNRFAGKALQKVDLLYQAGILMNGQIVLCKGVNDGQELERSIADLTKYLPFLRSVSVVPVGITKYREGLYDLELFTAEDAAEVLQIIHTWQTRIFQDFGIHFIHGSDEWYILSDCALPQEVSYDGYPQLENGVGMLRLLIDEIKAELKQRSGDERHHKLSMATGKLAEPYIRRLIQNIQEKYPNLQVKIFPIRNDFFGETITVSGLVTGGDIYKQLVGQDLGDKLLISENMLKKDEPIFLDDMSMDELSKRLQIKVEVVASDGTSFVNAVVGVET
ncbi:MAG: DUF512 domain-containing protein [Lachnospiraceae bacterium]|nr:DUF512 domain-containing protein [Lachnospiraceae bacterium]